MIGTGARATGDDWRDYWRTPPHVVAALVAAAARGPLAVDLCATADDRVAPAWIGPGSPICTDLRALPRDWIAPGVAWCNPPYSQTRSLVPAILAVAESAPVLLLVPARPETLWHRRAVTAACAILCPTSRIAYLPPSHAPAGTAGTSPVAATWVLVIDPRHPDAGVPRLRYVDVAPTAPLLLKAARGHTSARLQYP